MKKNIRILFFLLITLKLTSAFAQENGTVLVIVNTNAKILIDGEDVGYVKKSIPSKFETIAGEHYIQAINDEENLNKGEIVTIEAGEQKIFKIDFDIKNKLEPIKVADLNFSITGSITVAAWISNNSGKAYPDYPKYYYAFEEGDEIVINCSMSNLKGTNIINISTFPDNVKKYSNKSFTELNNLRLSVEKRAIYKFEFATNHAFNRTCFLTIERIPSNEEKKNFNTTVKWTKEYKPVTIVKAQKNYINSGSHATFKGGKSRITIPINLPKNTVKWYYTVTASRKPENIESVSSTIDMAGELAKLINVSGGLLSFGIEQMTKPPGSDYCDVYLLDFANSQLFEAKEAYRYLPQGSRENIESGVVEIDCCLNDTYYIGIKNPDTYNGINTLIEVVAIIQEEGLRMEEQ